MVDHLAPAYAGIGAGPLEELAGYPNAALAQRHRDVSTALGANSSVAFSNELIAATRRGDLYSALKNWSESKGPSDFYAMESLVSGLALLGVLG